MRQLLRTVHSRRRPTGRTGRKEGEMRNVALRLGVLALEAIAAAVLASSALGQNYIVLYRSQAPADSAQRISAAGGRLVYRYGQIGVAIARSDSASFRASLLADDS